MFKLLILIFFYFIQCQLDDNDPEISYLRFGPNNFSLNFDYSSNQSLSILNSYICIENLSLIEFSNTAEDYISLNPYKVFIKETDMDLKFRTVNTTFLSSSDNCDLLTDLFFKSKNYMNINQLHLVNLTYPKKMCLAIFQLLSILELYFYNLTDVNKINFQYMKCRDSFKCPRFYNIIIAQSNFTLDKGLTTFLKYSMEIRDSNLIDIKEDTFDQFTDLKLLELSIRNFREFIKKPNKWMQFNDSNGKKLDFNYCYYFQKIKYENLPNQLTLVLNDSSENYDYPDKDFCNFIHLNHKYIVYPIIVGKKNLTCTCTMIWLVFNWRLIDYLNKFSSTDI